MGKTLPHLSDGVINQVLNICSNDTQQPAISYLLLLSFFFFNSSLILTIQTQLSVCSIENPNNIPNISAQTLDLP